MRRKLPKILRILRCLHKKDFGLLERNGDGDRAKAMSLLDESLTISSELGLRRLMEPVLSRWELPKA